MEVCVATKDIAIGETVSAANVSTKMWLVDLLPSEAVQTYSDIAGKQLTVPVVAGEVLSRQHFEASAEDIEVPEGMHAVSVQVKDAQAVGGALVVGSKVDVYQVGTSGTGLLARNVLVLACRGGASTATSATDKVTLAVPSGQVEQIIAATQKSELYFALPGTQRKGKEDE